MKRKGGDNNTGACVIDDELLGKNLYKILYEFYYSREEMTSTKRVPETVYVKLKSLICCDKEITPFDEQNAVSKINAYLNKEGIENTVNIEVVNKTDDIEIVYYFTHDEDWGEGLGGIVVNMHSAIPTKKGEKVVKFVMTNNVGGKPKKSRKLRKTRKQNKSKKSRKLKKSRKARKPRKSRK